MAFSTTSKTSTGLDFPHPNLTIITGKPTYASICRLQKELYANANAKTIPSLLGGGHNGHLALVMTDAEYLVISAVPYDEPIHPGAQPIHPANATAAQITEANRQYDATLIQVALHVSVLNALRRQILVAIDNKYLLALEHPDLGYTVSPKDMLAYIKTTYGDLTPNEIERNRATLTAPWNPDDDIEDLWLRIRDAQVLATIAQDPIEDPAAIRLTLLSLEASDVFDFALNNWRLKDDATKTMATFKEHFTKENSERERKLTAKTGGFHGADNAVVVPPPSAALLTTSSSTTPRPPGTLPPPTPAHIVLDSGVKMYYCWTHGLSKNPNHTSPTCNFKADGHIDTATADNLQGGSNTIGSGRPPRHAQSRATPRGAGT
jgi:hypothetical protein